MNTDLHRKEINRESRKEEDFYLEAMKPGKDKTFPSFLLS